MLAHVFACCLSRKHEKPRVQDEEAHLIPPNMEITPSYSSSPCPHILKERMLDIVRSKESKMVNVAARAPFHFHNPRADPFSTYHYSRSASASSLPHDLLSSRPFLPSHKFHMSRSSSATFPSPTTALYPDDRSASRARSSRSPAFNIRLVRPPGLPADISSITRGRPRKKAEDEHSQNAEGPGVRSTTHASTSAQPAISPTDFNIGPLVIGWGD